MKKILLGGTALVGAALLAHPAAAQLSASAGGQANFTAGFWDEDRANANDRDFEIDAEVRIRATGKAENGLTYGADIQIETGGSRAARTDEAFMFIAGSWGRIELGDEDGAAGALGVYAPTVGLSQIDGTQDGFIGFAPTNPFEGFTAQDSFDETKITYITPRFAGFQAGISYIPEIGRAAAEGDANQTDDDDLVATSIVFYQDVIDIAANYTNKFGDFAVTLSGAVVFGDAGESTGGPNVDDYTSWAIGAQIAAYGFTVGGSYIDHGDFVTGTTSVGLNATTGLAVNDRVTDISGWNIGVSYVTGPFGVAVQYQQIDAERVGVTGGTTVVGDEVEWTVIGGGVSYVLAPGLTLGADLIYYEQENDTANVDDQEAVIFLVGTRFSF